MGEIEPLEIIDSSDRPWVGTHDTELIHLASLFESLVEHQFVEPIENEFWREAMPPGFSFIRPLGERTAQLRLAQGQVVDVVLRFAPARPRKGFRRITGPVQHSRAQQRYMWSQRLRTLGINTPRPLGYLESASDPSFEASFLVSEYTLSPTILEFKDDKIVGILRSHQNAAFEKNALQKQL